MTNLGPGTNRTDTMAHPHIVEDIIMSQPSPSRPHRGQSASIGRIDEGFSEAEAMDIEEHPAATPTPEPIDIDPTQQSLMHYPQWRDSLLQLPLELRATLFRDLMASLPTSQLATLIREADARLHLDPITLLPPEISTLLLKYLAPQDVTTAAHVSRNWRATSNQPTIWRRLFVLEGWHVRPEVIRQFEHNARAQLELYLSRDRSADQTTHHHRALSRVRTKNGRAPSMQQDLDYALVLQDMQNSGSGFVYDRSLMQRLWVKAGCLAIPRSDWRSLPGDGQSFADAMQILATGSPEFARQGSGLSCPLLYPEACWNWRFDRLQLNWQHLFTQRQRLERNWRTGSYKIFRIPKLENDDQRHKECVYTLQFSPRHVVSGSRDHTIRIWDIETQKLTEMPLGRKYSVLHEHKGSVLCLQFDDRPERDVIVSGGSDSALIVWKFSSGEKIQKIQKAHSQAVLNLRFDDRYLVTCSKDSSIKVWNMARIFVTDDAYPAQNQSRDATYPDYIIDKSALEANPKLGLSPPIEPWTHIMTLNGHTAAVNAISMYKDEIVSVSGDRKVMRWNLTTGRLLKIYSGHEKGIACVHYDGRRIVSGSSDESVRIFDPESCVQVDRLNGHRDLVRTLQADFGDMPGDGEQEIYEAKARAHTESILEDRRPRLFREVIDVPRDSPRGQARNRVMRHEHDATSKDEYLVGARLPLGGGGNKWAKIVSGSYDETVILWTQNKKGRWQKCLELRHEDAVNATAAQPAHPPHAQRPGQARAAAAMRMAQNAQQTLTAAQHAARVQQRQRHLQAAQAPANVHLQQQQVPITDGSIAAHAAQNQAYGPQTQAGHQAAAAIPNTPIIAPLNQPTQQPLNGPAPALAQTQNNNPRLQQQIQQQMQMQQQFAQQTQQMQQARQLLLQRAGQAGAPHQNQQQAQEDEEGTSRLFKLQFDARRIVCCSQQQVIVGWDFANGDKDIIEASQFFGEMS